jgi:protein SCO1/2
MLSLVSVFFLSGTLDLRAEKPYEIETTDNEGYVIINEKLGEYLPSSLVFTDTDGKEVRLLDVIDRPTIISPVYYNCPGLCTPVMDGIVKLIQRTSPELGEDYQVINISFNETETPQLALSKKGNYLGVLEQTERYGSTSASAAWHFMTGDRENIDLLLESLGFSIVRKGQDIFHPAGIMLVSREGKIVKYIHGTKYNPVEFEMAVLNAKKEETTPTIAKIMKACFNYEPAGRNKQLNITILGFIVMLSIALVIFVAFPPLRNKA